MPEQKLSLKHAEAEAILVEITNSELSLDSLPEQKQAKPAVEQQVPNPIDVVAKEKPKKDKSSELPKEKILVETETETETMTEEMPEPPIAPHLPKKLPLQKTGVNPEEPIVAELVQDISPTEVSDKLVVEQAVNMNHNLGFQETPHQADDAIVEEGILETLETFEEFADNLITLEEAPLSLEIHEPIVKIIEITAQIRETLEVTEDLREELVATFIVLFERTGLKYEEEHIRQIVDLWIKHDVLQRSENSGVVYKDDGMRENLQHFMHGVGKLKQLIGSLHSAVGGFVLFLLMSDFAREEAST